MTELGIIKCIDCLEPATILVNVENYSIPLCSKCNIERGNKKTKEVIRTVVLKVNTGRIEPNLYDMETTCNGCGNSLVKKLGIEADLIFYTACLKHDFRYSKYSNCSKEEADDLFKKEMQELIDDGDYNFAVDLLLETAQELYYQLVDNFGDSSYQKYDPSFPLPSTVFEMCYKIREKKIKCVSVKELLSDNTYINRWWIRSEAEVLGLI